MLISNISCWPFREAENIIRRRKNLGLENKQVIFETGFGPSGLPHIGTFGEVLRTTIVKNAFEYITGERSKLYVFSDDMDGMRKIPSNIPNQEMLQRNINKSLTNVPDPFGKHSSFAAHNNALLIKFLDDFNFQYEFKSSTEVYKSGLFNDTILKILEKYDQIMDVMIPSLREERQRTYSPFLPICKKTGHVLQVPIIERNLKSGTIVYIDPVSNEKVETEVINGNCKLQWKVDWAMRWVALSIDYEMCGKDLVDSLTLSNKISKILGMEPPANLTYELFLDDKGFKISKSKGNGITIEDWFKYGNKESLSFYMFQSPTKAKKLHYNVIPRAMDEYLIHLDKFSSQDEKAKLENPAWHIHNGKPISPEIFPVSFGMITNLANLFNTNDPEIIWNCLSKYNAKIKPGLNPKFDKMVVKAIKYYNELVKRERLTIELNKPEISALNELIKILESIDEKTLGEDIQTEIYNIGNNHQFDNLRNWFKCIYRIILGQDDGPRLGHLISLFGTKKSAELIKKSLM